MTDECSPSLLQRALTGDLSPQVEEKLHSHLETCDECSRAIEELSGGNHWCQEAASLLVEDELDDATPTHDEWSDIDFTVEHLESSSEPNVLGQLGGYDVLEVIGRGGMGVVLKGYDKGLKRCVAIKVLAPHLAQSALAKKRFAREAQAAAAVVHSNVLAIHQVQATGRLPFLVMPLVAGESLAHRLSAQGSLELIEILRIGMQAAAGLAAAHEQGLVHRDVKPANILLEKGIERAVLTDFGLARAADDVALTRWGIIAGTPQYMSPEQAKGEAVDARSDLFSLGCVLYEMATGISPFRTETTMATLRRLIDDAPQLLAACNPELPPWFCAIVTRLLEKDPVKRYSSAKEVSELLEGCLAHVQQPANVPLPEGLPKTPRLCVWSFSKRRSTTLAALAALGLGITITAFMLLTAPLDIAGEWTGEDWGPVVLTATADGEYTGTYSETFDKQTPGKIQLRWSRIECQYTGTWGEGQNRFGDISLRLTENEIRGAYTTDPKSKFNPDTPHLADLHWVRLQSGKPVIGSHVKDIDSDPGNDVRLRFVDKELLTASRSFEPTVEVTINDESTGNDCFLNFDTGELITPPAGAFQPDQLRELAEKSHADISFYSENGSKKLRMFGGIIFFLLDPWDSQASTILQKVRRLERARLKTSHSIPTFLSDVQFNERPPGNFAFKTRTGRIGVLQILGTNENPPGVKIRYKVLQELGEGVASQAGKEVIRRFMQALRDRKFKLALQYCSEQSQSRITPSDLEKYSAPFRDVFASGLENRADFVEWFQDGNWLAGWTTRPPNSPHHGAAVYATLTSEGWQVVDLGPTSSTESLRDLLEAVRTAYMATKSSPKSEKSNDQAGSLTLKAENDRVVIESGDAKFSTESLTLYPPLQSSVTMNQAPTFGPIIELVISDVQPNQFFDFETGKFVEFPKDKPPRKDDHAWLRENGVDAIGDTSDDNPGLSGSEIMVSRVANDQWETPTFLFQMIGSPKPDSFVNISGKGELPATYLFQTREGGKGILQILSVSNESDVGIKFRYKMLQTATASNVVSFDYKQTARKFMEAIRDTNPDVAAQYMDESRKSKFLKVFEQNGARLRKAYAANPDLLMTIRDHLVDGDVAAVRMEPPAHADKSITIFLLHTNAGWRVANLDDLKLTATLSNFIERGRRNQPSAKTDIPSNPARPSASSVQPVPLNHDAINSQTRKPSKSLSVKLPHGGEVVLHAIGNMEDPHGTWWAPDGKPIQGQPEWDRFRNDRHMTSVLAVYELVYPKTQPPSVPLSPAGNELKTPHYGYVDLPAPINGIVPPIEIGVGVGPWKSHGKVVMDQHFRDGDLRFRIDNVEEAYPNGIDLRYETNFRQETEVALVAISKQGKRIDHILHRPASPILLARDTQEIILDDVPIDLKDLEGFELFSRPRSWASFRGIAAVENQVVDSEKLRATVLSATEIEHFTKGFSSPEEAQKVSLPQVRFVTKQIDGELHAWTAEGNRIENIEDIAFLNRDGRSPEDGISLWAINTQGEPSPQLGPKSAVLDPETGKKIGIVRKKQGVFPRPWFVYTLARNEYSPFPSKVNVRIDYVPGRPRYANEKDPEPILFKDVPLTSSWNASATSRLLENPLTESIPATLPKVPKRVSEPTDTVQPQISAASDIPKTSNNLQSHDIADLPIWTKDGKFQYPHLLLHYLRSKVDTPAWSTGTVQAEYDAPQHSLKVKAAEGNQQQIAQLISDLKAKGVSNQDRNSDIKFTQLYSIADLPLWTKDGKEQNPDLLIRYLQSTIEPAMWQSKEIRAIHYATNSSLILEAKRNIHTKISDTLTTLRRDATLFQAIEHFQSLPKNEIATIGLGESVTTATDAVNSASITGFASEVAFQSPISKLQVRHWTVELDRSLPVGTVLYHGGKVAGVVLSENGNKSQMIIARPEAKQSTQSVPPDGTSTPSRPTVSPYLDALKSNPQAQTAEQPVAKLVLVFFQDKSRRAVPSLPVNVAGKTYFITAGPATIVPSGTEHAIDRAFVEREGKPALKVEFDPDTSSAELYACRALENYQSVPLRETVSVTAGETVTAEIDSVSEQATVVGLHAQAKLELPEHKVTHHYEELIELNRAFPEGTPLFKNGKLVGLTLLGTRFSKDAKKSYVVPARRLVELCERIEKQRKATDGPAVEQLMFPRILKTVPEIGATNVDPDLKEISVTFDRDMRQGMSWTGSPPLFPPIDIKPKCPMDRRTHLRLASEA